MVRTIAFTLLLCTFATAGLLNTSIADGTDITFQVSNQQPASLGMVAVTTTSSLVFYLGAPDENTYSVRIPDDAASVTIAGQTVAVGDTAHVMLPNGAIVGVKWSSPSNVVVVDKDEIL